MRAALFGLCVVVVGCASTSRQQCDPSAPGCVADDAAIAGSDASIVAIDASPDGPLEGFGDPCSDSHQCQSGICILVGTSGVCSQMCGDCPDGYGCLGVVGAIDPDQVAYVCVPESSQLCSPCQSDTECTLIGMDKCVTEATGRTYCGRDCSTVSCPAGYACTDTVINSVNYRECVPQSGACDCNTAAQQGATDPCTITTALGTGCAGTATCGGTAGWSGCQPPSATDDPDATYTDDNCDGIDGDITKGIFVAGGGADSATCGLTFNAPCQTVSHGIVRAVQAGRPNVYVQAGTYNEVVVLLNGVDVWGGYDFSWQRGPSTDPAHRVTITGKQDTGTGGDGEYLTVRAHDLIVPVTLADLVLQGPAASGTGGMSGLDGRSSYVVHAKAASVSLVRVQIVGGNGAPGGNGGAGTDAVAVDAQSFMVGGTGGDGVETTSLCDNSTRGGGGGAGTNTCTSSPSSRATNGGAGGAGGTMDKDCSVFSLDLTAQSGAGGSAAPFVLGTFGQPGGGGSGGSSCGMSGGGNPGAISNGAAGGANAGGYVSSSYWYARGGTSGATGQNGGGGGGGGGAGGCDNGTDSYGGGGGGGGAGGCAARGGGGGGGGGGGAFGVAAMTGSSVTLDTCQLFRGNAGTGGAGGTGGRGQSGGPAGPPGARAANGSAPGAGGKGGHGGHGGGGGGGQGGRAVGILRDGSSTITGSCTQSQGTGGAGGSGGTSAPTAPAAERDGNDGSGGAAGTLEDVRACNSTTDC